MNTWIKQLGYPVVTYNFDKDTDTIKLSQEHFLLDPSSIDHRPVSEFDYVWNVPISYVTNQDTDFENETHYKYERLTGKSGEITGVTEGSDWIIGNVLESFYYRVNYNEENWVALADVLKNNHEQIDVKNRAQLVDDSFNLGRAGIENQTLFFEITQYLDNENEYIPWWSASRGFSYVNKMLGVTGEYGLFKNYIAKQFAAQYNRLGWDETGSSHTEKLMRSLVVQYACTFGNDDCEQVAMEEYKNWRDTDTNEIAPNLRYAVYCTAIAAGDEDEWDFAFEQFKNTTSGSEQKTLMQALACTKTEWLLRRYLEKAFAEVDIRRQDFSTVFIAISGNSQGRMLAWEFMINHWTELHDRLAGSISFDRIVKAPASGFSTPYHYNLVRVFKESRDDLGATENAFNQVLDEIAANIEWRKKNQGPVTEWLKKQTTA